MKPASCPLVSMMRGLFPAAPSVPTGPVLAKLMALAAGRSKVVKVRTVGPVVLWFSTFTRL